ncbi:hemagglutinin repeat-containing protein [Pantoea sp. JK]|nr:hemagglutinin repeat-containing protein [Pantoea sp. JK]
MTLSGDALNNSGSVQGKTLAITPASVTNQGSLIGLQSLTIGPASTRGFRMMAVQSRPARELINNAGGQLLTQGALNISGDDITNNGSWQGQQILLNATRLANNGAIQIAGDLTLNISDALTSTSGSKITANGNAALNALSLTNQGQWIAGNLTLKGTTLTNGGEISGVNGLTAVLGGTLTQQQNGALLSGGKLDVQAATASNDGRIQGGDLTITTGTLTNNGRLQGDKSLLLTTRGRITNNNSGTLISQSGLTLTTPELYNYGLIQGATNRITASSSATNSGKMLSGGELTLTTPQLVNSGWLQAAQLTLNAANASNSGTLLADQQGTLTGSQLLNQGTAQGGSLAVNYSQLNNSGTLLGANQLDVKASQVTQQAAGKLFSGGNMLLESTGFDQLGQVVALGDATLKLINSFTARNTLVAGNRLTISSNGAIENQGTLQGQALTLSAGGDLTNNGQLTTGTGDSSLSGNRINMNSAGTLQGGGNVALISRSDVALNGFTGTRGSLTISSPGSIVNTALLYAGQNLYLYANSIQNQRGDMLAGNSLWMQRDAAGNANGEVINTSGTIESQNGDITIRTGHLLNTREGLITSEEVTQLATPSWANGPNVRIPFSWFKPGDYYKYVSGTQQHHGHGDDWETHTYSYAPNADVQVQKIAYQSIAVTANASGGAGRIAAGRDLNVQAAQLDNSASSLLASNNMALSGRELNNQSWTDGTSTAYQIYRYSGGATSSSFGYTLDDSPAYETTGSGNVYRAAIQAGGNVNASFSGDISNTSTTSNAGWTGTTVNAPALNQLAAIGQVAAQQRQQLAAIDKMAINSPEWRDQLQNALQQVNGGTSLQNAQPETVGLSNHNGKQQGNANLGKAAELASGSAVKPSALGSYGASAVDTSAYPLPTSDNGYFVPGDSSSPYLITVNPKLNGLGHLDASLFGDLNQLLGKQPGSAPQESRQQYTDVNTFLGSSYLLDRLNLKPDNDYRFLGDAAFDTRYVSNIVLNQTGSRYLNGVGSDLDQMRYLMDNAAASQQALGLQFGVSLTADQVASLDKSIIWWEATSVNGQTVMVPKVYLSEKDAAMNNGSVIAGNNVTLSGGNITNSASTIVAQNAVSADSQNNIDNLKAGLIKAGGELNLSALNSINNVSSTISGKKVALESVNGDINNITASSQWTIGGNGPVQASKTLLGQTAAITSLDALSLKSGNDINITGASLNAGGDLLLSAWHDLSLNSIETSESRKTGNKETHSSGAERTTLSSGGNLTLVAGQDVTSQAAALAAEGDISLQAGRDINLNAVESRSGDSERGSKKTVINEAVRQQGTEIASGGSTTLIAGHDIISHASDVTAQQDITLHAGNNVDLGTATESDYYYKEETKTKKGLLSKKTTHTIQEDSATNEKGTLLSGNNVSISAGNDLLVTGSQVVGDGKVALSAGNNVEIAAATNTDSTWRFSETKKSGLMGTGGLGISIGSSKTLHEIKDKGTTQSQSISTVGSTAGDVSITAGKQLLVNGADLIAGSNMALQGDSVTITPGHDLRSRDERFEQRTSGLTLALSGAVAEAVNSTIETVQYVKNESDDRLLALQATKSVLSGVQTGQASQLAQANGDPNNGIGISLSLTTQQSKSQQHQKSDTVSGSSINAGNNLSIDATGKGNGINSGDLLIAGSQLKAGGDTSLHAANDITLAATANTQQTTGKNSSSGGGIGISFGVGSGSAGLSIFASVNGAKGHEKGNGTVWTETTLDSGGEVSISSGRDTTLSGAQVNGNSVTADIGRDLTIASLQDSDNYDSKQVSFGAGGSFTFGSMTGSGYINASQDKMHSNYDSVLEQSGIYAGKGGFDITVGNHTQLNGAVIASQADADKNRLDTGTLGFTDIHNEADYKTQHQGIGISSGASMGGQFVGNMANTMLAGAGGKGHAEGTTQSAVADGTIVIRDTANQQQDVRDLSRDTENANDSIGQIFNKEKEQKRLQTAQLIGEIGAQAVDIAATQGKIMAINAGRAELEAKGISAPDAYATPEERAAYDKLLTNTSSYKTTQAQWGTGSAIQQGIQAATAAIQGLAGGNIAQALSGAAAPYLAEIIKKTAPNESSRIIAHAVLGAVVAQASGNSGMAGAAGAAATALIGESLKKSLYGDIPVSQLNEEQKQTLVALGSLAAGLTGGLAGGDSAGSMTGAQAGKNEISNNMAGAGMLSQMLAHETLNSAAMAEAGKGGANEQAALALTNKVKEGLDETCRKSDVCVLLAVMSAQNQSDSNDSQKPNIGKDLSNEQKNEMGGTGSGTPDGWGPEDEDSARNEQLSSNFDEKFNKNDLLSSASEPINDQGLSAAARAWEKHAGRLGGSFDPLKGNVSQKNEAAKQFVNEVLGNTNTVRTDLSRGGVEFRLPDGKGVRYNADGSFSGFLDPKR